MRVVTSEFDATCLIYRLDSFQHQDALFERVRSDHDIANGKVSRIFH